MNDKKNHIVVVMKRKIAAAKAEKGFTWNDIAEKIKDYGINTEAGNLMAKNSRGTFKIVEFIIIMNVLGQNVLNIEDFVSE